MSIDEKRARYLQLCHAVQTGVAMEMEFDRAPTTPKHLRTGINVGMSNHAALVELLIAKGIITEDEYWDSLIASLEREVKTYEQRLRQRYGGEAKITLL